MKTSTQQQILSLVRLGWPLRRIEEATGVRRETVSPYLRAAGIAVRRPGRPREDLANAAISSAVSTDSPAPPAAATASVSTGAGPTRAPSASACASYREVIVEALSRGRNAMAIRQDLVGDHGFAGQYASVRRFVATLRTQAPTEACVVIVMAPGEEAQVGNGDGPMVWHPESGKHRRTLSVIV